MKHILVLGSGSKEYEVPNARVTTIDIEAALKPSIVWDLNQTPWPLEDNSVDQIVAMEVLEHLGAQGDLQSFFAHFYEMWRILRPDGVLAATVPAWDSIWAWGDPGHRRVINAGTITFVDREAYRRGLKVTPMADYRSLWRGDFEILTSVSDVGHYAFTLRAKKPVRE